LTRFDSGHLHIHQPSTAIWKLQPWPSSTTSIGLLTSRPSHTRHTCHDSPWGRDLADASCKAMATRTFLTFRHSQWYAYTMSGGLTPREKVRCDPLLALMTSTCRLRRFDTSHPSSGFGCDAHALLTAVVRPHAASLVSSFLRSLILLFLFAFCFLGSSIVDRLSSPPLTHFTPRV